MTAQILAATPGDILWVAERLRPEDRQELETASTKGAVEAVFRAWAFSELAWVAHIDGKPAVVFGVCEGGVIWLVGTDAISQAKLSVFKIAKTTVGLLLKKYERLHNAADCRNTLHLRWLQLLGFTFDQVGSINGHPFQFFHLDREESTSCANP